MTIGHKLLGQGEEKVMVFHGWQADHSVFEPMFPALDLERFTFAFIDYRGYGLSKEIKGEHTIEEIGLDALELADFGGWERFHLIGHSMGGLAIQWVMAHATERIKSAVAITPVPASGVTFSGDELDLFQGAANNPDNRDLILMYSVNNRHNEAWKRSMHEKTVTATTTDAYADYFTAWSTTNIVAEVEGLKTPIKVLVGEHDPHLTAEVMQQTYLKWLPNAELEVLKNAGHYPMLEIPINLATICDNFIWSHR